MCQKSPKFLNCQTCPNYQTFRSFQLYLMIPMCQMILRFPNSPSFHYCLMNQMFHLDHLFQKILMYLMFHLYLLYHLILKFPKYRLQERLLKE
jgi:hypothetical protein